jgi:hypothetical protein
VAQNWQTGVVAEAAAAVYKPPRQLVGVTQPDEVGALVEHVTVPATPPHHDPDVDYVQSPTVKGPALPGATSVA